MESSENINNCSSESPPKNKSSIIEIPEETKVNIINTGTIINNIEPKESKSQISSESAEQNLLEKPGIITKSKTCDSDFEFCIKPDTCNANINANVNKDEGSVVIKSEILEEEEEDEGLNNNSMEDEDDDEEGDASDFAIGGNKSVQYELKKCKGRLDAFGHELKLLCAELEIVTGWIDQHFGIKLINKESLLFKHIYDFEEIEQISAALSLLSEVGKQQEQKGSTRRGRGRKPAEKPLQNSTPGQKRGRRKKTKENLEDELINPQDFLETIYDEKDADSQNQSRPKRATRRKINYKEEDKDIEIPQVLKQAEANDSEEDEFDGPEEFYMEDGADSDFVNDDPDDKKPPKPKRKRNSPKKKKSTEDKTETQDEGDDAEPGEDGDSDSQTDGNGDSEAGQGKKKRVRKRYPKKPGVVWNSSLPKQCDECGKVLKGTSTLKLHKMMHADERPHTCEVCGNKFRFRRNLKVHMMAIHTGERPLQCSFCGRKFYAPKDLRIHERTHTGEKPYPCSVCPKRFNVKEHLTMHTRVHTGEKPYICPICQKSFSQANSLRIHKKIHTRDKEPTPRKPRKPKNPQQTPQNNPPGPSTNSIINLNINTNSNSNAPTPSPQSQSITPIPQQLQQQQQHPQHQHSLSSVVSAAALLQQLNPHHSNISNMSSPSHTNSGHSSPMPAHMNSNLMSDKLPFTSSNTVPHTSSFSSINSSAMNFHQQAHSNMQHQNPFIVPLNENWRMPFSTAGVDHQRFASPSNSNASNNSNSSRNLGNRSSDNFGGPLNQSGSHHHVTDPRFHSFYSQNQ